MSRRILFVVDSLFPLGPALQLKVLAGALADSGADVHIVALDEQWETPLSRHFPATTVYGLNKGIIRGSRQLILAPRLRKLIRSVKPDIVHGWCESASTIAAMSLCRLEKVRFFCTELWETPEKRLLQYLAGRWFARTPEAIVVPHDSLKEQLVEVHHKPPHLLRVIPNTALVPKMGHAASRKLLLDRLGIPSDSWIAGTAAPFTARTRLKDLIWATDQLACFRDDVHLVIFGEGAQESRLRHFLSLTEATPYVHFMGNDPDVLSLINGVDFYWHPHLREPLPSGMLHAMAGNIPVVGVYGPQTSDLIVPQTTGLATNFGARDEFARWTKYLIERRDSAAQLARQGRAHVKARFSAEKMVDAYVEMYGTV